MKIAVTYDRGNVGQHFGRTQFFKVFTVEEGNLVKGELLPGGEHGHVAKAQFVKDNDIAIIICGGIGQPAVAGVKAAGAEVYPGVTGSVDQAVQDFIAGQLKFNMDAIHAPHGEHHHHQWWPPTSF